MKILSTLAISILLIASALPAFAQGKDFKDKDIKDKTFDGSALNAADFSEATLSSVMFRNVSAKEAKFTGALIKFFSVFDSDFTGSDFRETQPTGLVETSDFSKVNMEGVKLNVRFHRVKFKGANLKNTTGWSGIFDCDFAKADLRGANLRGVTVDPSSNFRGAIYDKDTTWPEGFDPVAAGAKLQEGETKADADKTDKKSNDDPK